MGSTPISATIFKKGLLMKIQLDENDVKRLVKDYLNEIYNWNLDVDKIKVRFDTINERVYVEVEDI